MKSIYITDLDHTFLNSHQRVSDISVEIWNRKSKEAILSVATARGYGKSMKMLSRLHLDAPMIFLDGAMIVSPEKKIIDLKTINRDLGNAIIAEGECCGIYPFVVALGDDATPEEMLFYPTKLNSYQSEVLKKYRDDPQAVEMRNIEARDLNLKIVYFGKFELLDLLGKKLIRVFGEELEFKLSPEKYTDGWMLTILHPEADKSTALVKVMHHLGRDMSDLTVFGDSVNDMGMFEIAGTSVAVSNALDEVKEIASIVLPLSNDQDAVAKYLENIQG